jgi:protein-L-isoaspartate(D-aspartate) O-methyltransferase
MTICWETMRTAAPLLLCGMAVWQSLRTDADAADTETYRRLRRAMVNEAVVGAGVTDERVIQAISTTPRHEFVPPKERNRAYFDMALPIGSQQTISSPFIVAYMTEALEPQATDRVLEIGTGSGYQAAVLSPLVKDVYSIEIVKDLGETAARTLRRLKYENVHTRIGDGYQGWPTAAPFDKIIVTCSPEKPPQALVTQLREGGRMVIPVGERYQQTLYLFTKKDGKLEPHALRPTLFVPMTGAAEARREVKPDPANPQVIGGTFEEEPGEDGHVVGWYYQRQFERVEDDLAPSGSAYGRATNQERGRPSQALQGFPIDGRQVAELTIHARVRTQRVMYGVEAYEKPMIAVTLYNDVRKELGMWWLGPWDGTSDWQTVEKTMRVPLDAREGILRIGLFGATGTIDFDDIRFVVKKRAGR